MDLLRTPEARFAEVDGIRMAWYETDPPPPAGRARPDRHPLVGQDWAG
ncbi:hypothetical protein ACFWY5_14660 [Nonomuraea sp. NPDC059007]